jgi:hypothetical protein
MFKLDGFDEAILGPTYVFHIDGSRVEVLAYDAEGIRAILMREGMDSDEAREYIEFNIEGAYMGPGTPILVWTQDMVWGEYDD